MKFGNLLLIVILIVVKRTKKFEIEKRQKVNIEPLLPVIQNLTSMGHSIADIGMILGYAGKDKRAWLNNLKENNPEIQEAIEAGKNLADAELVKTAFKEVTGYTIEEIKTEYKAIQDSKNPDKVKWVATKKTKNPKYIQPNAILLFKLLCSRLPDYFADSKKIEINKTNLDIKDVTAEEIRRFSGKFAKLLDAEVTDAKFEETDDETAG